MTWKSFFHKFYNFTNHQRLLILDHVTFFLIFFFIASIKSRGITQYMTSLSICEVRLDHTPQPRQTRQVQYTETIYHY